MMMNAMMEKRKKRESLSLITCLLWVMAALLPGYTFAAEPRPQAINDATYSYTVVARLYDASGDSQPAHTITLQSGSFSETTTVDMFFNRYILEGTTLYKTVGNTMARTNNTITTWCYRNTYTVDGADMTFYIDYYKEKENVVFFSEAEDINSWGTRVENTHSDYNNWSKYQGRFIALSSNGGAVKPDVSTSPTITNLVAGKYRIYMGLVGSAGNDSGTYQFKADGDNVGSTIQGTDIKDKLNEYDTGEFTLTASKAITVTHNVSNNTGVDYLYIVHTAAIAPTVTLTVSPLSGVRTDDVVTLSATPTLNGNSALASVRFQYKVGTGGTWTDVAQATTSGLQDGVAVTQTFTPTVQGTYFFRVEVTDNGSFTDDGSGGGLVGTAETDSGLEVAQRQNGVAVSASETNTDLVTPVTLTATVDVVQGTLSDVVIEQQVEGVYTQVAQGTASTLTYVFEPTETGTFVFWAKATIGGTDYTSETTTVSVGIPAAKDITFYLFDAQGNAVTQAPNATATAAYGASVEETMPASLKRQFCTYSYYDSDSFDNEISTLNATAFSNGRVYVKWAYSDNAPVFSTGTDPEKFQYYVLKRKLDNQADCYIRDDNGNLARSNRDVVVTNLNFHWAFVGNPYALKVYHRATDEYMATIPASEIKNDGTISFTDDVVDAQVWDLPDLDADAYPNFRVLGTQQCYWNLVELYNSNKTYSPKQLMRIIVPLKVYDGNGNLKDSQEYMIDYPNSDGNITPQMLTEDNHYGNKIFRHAFCDYSLYADEAMEQVLTSSGTPFYGGALQQRKAVYATYSVSDDFNLAFLLNYVLNAQTTYFYKKKTGDDGLDISSQAISVIRNDDTNEFRWKLVGDPYSLQLTNMSIDDSECYPLGSKSIGLADPAANTDLTMLFSNDAAYRKNYVFEAIETAEPTAGTNETTYHVKFYLLPNGNLSERYKGGIAYYNGPKLVVAEGSIASFNLTTAVPQYNVTWNVRFGGNTVASLTKERVTEGMVLTVDDMPASLRRHYLDYTGLFTSVSCEGSPSSYTVVDNDGQNIYVQAAYTDDAPTFYATAGDAATDDWYMIHTGSAFLYAGGNGKVDFTPDTDGGESERQNAAYLWRLVGSPYGLTLYNKDTQTYLAFSGTDTNDDLVMAASPTIVNLLDDYQGDLAAMCYMADGIDVFANQWANVQAGNTSDATSTEFLSTKGINGVTFTLHYGEYTLRPGMNAQRTETITVNGYQAVGKKLLNVFPDCWKRAFCEYAFSYDENTVTAITESMVGQQPVTIDVTYDRLTACPFDWSDTSVSKEGKHWYYFVNNHRQGSEQGKLVKRDVTPTLRISDGLLPTGFYTFNYEWCVMGDPYGFKALNRYDPDHRFVEFLSVTDETDSDSGLKVFALEANNDRCVFEMMPGNYSGSFWIHPAYTQALREEAIRGGTCSFFNNNSNGSQGVLASDNCLSVQNSDGANIRLEIQTPTILREYVKYAGFVGALRTDIVNSTSMVVDGNTENIGAIKAKVNSGVELTAAENLVVSELIDHPDYMVNMCQGYYRIIPYMYEVDGKRYYLRGYLYGNGMGDSREYYGDDNVYTHALVMNENVTDAEYDPASVFHFALTETAEDYPRYEIGTQGMWLQGTALYGEQQGYKCRYEEIGGVLTQLRTADNDGADYLSWVQPFGNETEEDDRHVALRSCFEMYGYTRLYLQPVGEDENELPLKLALNKPTVADGYAYSTLYVPYDVMVDNDEAQAFYAKSENANNGDYRLTCETVNALTGKNAAYVPAGSPVLVRTPDTVEEVTLILPADAPDTDSADAIAKHNLLQGSYLEETIESDSYVYVFGYSGKFQEVGFFIDNNHESNYRNWTVKHNRCFYISGGGGNSVNEFLLDFNAATDGVGQVTVRHDEGNDDVYDLSGRKVSARALKPGIYVTRGKKFIVK